jgi:hypothetical protein
LATWLAARGDKGKIGTNKYTKNLMMKGKVVPVLNYEVVKNYALETYRRLEV